MKIQIIGFVGREESRQIFELFFYFYAKSLKKKI